MRRPSKKKEASDEARRRQCHATPLSTIASLGAAYRAASKTPSRPPSSGATNTMQQGTLHADPVSQGQCRYFFSPRSMIVALAAHRLAITQGWWWSSLVFA